MNTRQNILQNLTALTKFEPTSPKKIYYVNCLTTYNTMTELIELVSQKKQFGIETKYDNISKVPELIQILFAHKFILYIILVETVYIPRSSWYLHSQIISLFSIILSPSNIIQSWSDTKIELISFLDCCIFNLQQIENIQTINIKKKFQKWFQNNFADIQLNNIPSDNWTLEMALAFLFEKYLDTSLSKSRDWDIGLFAHFETVSDEPLVHRNTSVLKLLDDNRCRSLLKKYAIHECMAVNKIAALLQNDWTQKHAESYLKKFYSNSQQNRSLQVTNAELLKEIDRQIKDEQQRASKLRTELRNGSRSTTIIHELNAQIEEFRR